MKLRYVLLTAAYCLLIFGLSSRPHLPDVGFSIPHLDKLVHAMIYGGLAAVVSLGMRWSGKRPHGWMRFIAPVLFAVLYGITDEVHQRFVPNRHFDLFDLLADGVGALLVQTVLWRWWRRKASPAKTVNSPAGS